MNEAPTQLIQHLYAAFGRGDVAFIAGQMHPQARWDFNVTHSDVPWHVPAVGPAEVSRFIAALMGSVTLQAFEPRQFIASGDEVVVHVRIAFVVKQTGKTVDQEQLHWWTVREAKVTRLRHFEDTAQVIAAWRA